MLPGVHRSIFAHIPHPIASCLLLKLKLARHRTSQASVPPHRSAHTGLMAYRIEYLAVGAIELRQQSRFKNTSVFLVVISSIIYVAPRVGWGLR